MSTRMCTKMLRGRKKAKEEGCYRISGRKIIRKMQGQYFQISICVYNISDEATEGFNPEEVKPQDSSRNKVF